MQIMIFDIDCFFVKSDTQWTYLTMHLCIEKDFSNGNVFNELKKLCEKEMSGSLYYFANNDNICSVDETNIMDIVLIGNTLIVSKIDTNNIMVMRQNSEIIL